LAKRPRDLIYSVDETPPWPHRIVLAVQHVCVISVGWIFIVLSVSLGGGTPEQAGDVIRISMIVSGVATILQARNRGAVGSGYLCPYSAGPAYISASVAAGTAGGLPLVFTLTTIAGLFEGLLARLVLRVRALFPPEVTGLVVAMVGIELVGLGAPRFIGLDPATHHVHDPRSFVVALITLVAMVVPTVWGRGKWRLYPVLFGMVAGYAAAAAFGLFTADRLRQALAAPWMSLPERAALGFAFDLSLLIPFLIASLASSLKAVGDITLCQKVNDADWKRTDLRSASGGLLAGAIATSLSGIS
jgi:NCS2 family nucleobase:cation symporter-2